MKYEKLDAPLVSALSDDEKGLLSVFIDFVGGLNQSQQNDLQSLGVHLPPTPQQPLSATVSSKAVDSLSELPFVRSLRAAGHSRGRIEDHEAKESD